MGYPSQRSAIWARQPQIACGLDKGNPLYSGLSACFDQRQGRELITGSLPSANTSTLQRSVGGVAAGFSGTANVQYASHPNFALTGQLTIATLVEIDAFSGYQHIISKQTSTTTGAPYEFRLSTVTAGDRRPTLLRANTNYGQTNVTSITTAAGLGFYAVRTASPNLEAVADFFANGSFVAAAAAGGGASGTGPATDNGSSVVWIGRRYEGSTQLTGRIYWVLLWNRALSDPEIFSLYINPWQLFEPLPRRIWVGAGGSYSAAIAEAIASADATSAALIANAAITEAMAAADATLAAMIAAVSASESVTLTDAPSATKTASGSVSESVTSTDAPSAAMTAAGSVSESVSAADTVTGSVNAVTGDVSESVTLTDAQTAAMTAAGAVAESVTLIDTVAGAMTASATLTESVTSTEVVDGAVGAVLASVSESVTLTDAPSALMTASVAIAESITATEVILAAMTASGVIAESITLLDVVGGGLPLTASVVEAASLADLVSAIIAQPIASDPRFIIRRATGRDWIIRGRASNWTVREPN